MRAKFCISILAHNQLESTKRCLESVLANSKDYQLILTDNGSTDGTRKYFDELTMAQAATVCIKKTNLGFIIPNQIAFDQCVTRPATPYFVMLNNDCIVSPGWLEKMEEVFHFNDCAAIVGVKNTPCTIGAGLGGLVSPVSEYVEFSCAMLNTEIFKKHGLFSPGLVGAYMEDQDCSLRMRELGYTIHHADVDVKHERHATSRHVPEVKDWIASNARYMQKRWAHYLKVRRFDYPLVIRSGDSSGNPMLSLSVLQAIKEARPLSPLYLETEMPESFSGLPFIAKAAKLIPPMKDELRISLDDKPTQTTRSGKSLLPGERIEKTSATPTVTMLYVMVMQSIEYQKHAVDFVESYLKNPPGYDHRTLIVCNGGAPDERTRSFFRKLPDVEYMTHDNSGMDIGAYIAGARKVDADMLVCMGSNTYLTKPNWLARLVFEWCKTGPGMYGAFASFEVQPHINTTLFAAPPDLLLRYPIKVNSRAERYDFEHGPNNFWQMVYADGYPVKLVTWDGSWDWQDWRKPANIYRRGDQSNCLGAWRLTDLYEKSDAAWKRIHETFSDRLTVKGFEP